MHGFHFRQKMWVVGKSGFINERRQNHGKGLTRPNKSTGQFRCVINAQFQFYFHLFSVLIILDQNTNLRQIRFIQIWTNQTFHNKVMSISARNKNTEFHLRRHKQLEIWLIFVKILSFSNICVINCSSIISNFLLK